MAADDARSRLSGALSRQRACLARAVQGVSDRAGRASADGAALRGTQRASGQPGGPRGGLAVVEPASVAIAAALAVAASGPGAATRGLAGVRAGAANRGGAGRLAAERGAGSAVRRGELGQADRAGSAPGVEPEPPGSADEAGIGGTRGRRALR